jgi:dTDP-4-dehydrorhamnose reductase
VILLLGANGYVGRAFARHLRARGHRYIPLSLDAFDYTHFDLLFDYLRKVQPEFVINAADETAVTDELSRERTRAEAVKLNMSLPQTVARACLMTNTPWGHVSSGSIYCGAKVFENGQPRVKRDENGSFLPRLFNQHPERIFGFTEQDEPNFSFRTSHCSFYSGTKALAEEALHNQDQAYIWRVRLPFNECDEPSNWLAQLQRRATLNAGLNSVSHLDDFVTACLELWDRRAPFGIYNVVNPGVVSTSQVLQIIQRILRPPAKLSCVDADELAQLHAKEWIPNCVLDGAKLRRQEVKLRTAEEALEDALEKWQSSSVSPLRERFKTDSDPTHHSSLTIR